MKLFQKIGDLFKALVAQPYATTLITDEFAPGARKKATLDDESRLELVESYKSFLEEKLGDLLGEKSHTLSIESNNSKDENGKAAIKYKLILNRSQYRDPEAKYLIPENPDYDLIKARDSDYETQLNGFLEAIGGRMYSYQYSRSAVYDLFTTPIPALLITNLSDAKSSYETVDKLIKNIDNRLPEIREQLGTLNKLSSYEIEGATVTRAREHFNDPTVKASQSYSLIS